MIRLKIGLLSQGNYRIIDNGFSYTISFSKIFDGGNSLTFNFTKVFDGGHS